MPPPDRLTCLRRWMQYAQTDMTRAEKRLREGDYEDAAFRTQQATEKALKAALVAESIPPDKTHNLESLLKALPPARGARLKGIMDLEQVTTWAVLPRYPGAAGMFDSPAGADVVRRMVGRARVLVDRVETEFCEPLPGVHSEHKQASSEPGL